MSERTGEIEVKRCPHCNASALYCPLHGERFDCLFCKEAIYVPPAYIAVIRKFGIACDHCHEQRTFKSVVEEPAQDFTTCTWCGGLPSSACLNCGRKNENPVPLAELPETKGFKPGEGFHEIAQRVADIVAEKNVAYGSSFDDCSTFLRLLWPQGVPVDAYSDMLAIVRIWDKLKRIATDRDALGEDPFSDILGYCLLALRRAEEVKRTAEEMKK